MSTNRVEQRRSKRIPTKMNLEVSSLFKQDNVKVNNINAPIEVIDISKDGFQLDFILMPDWNLRNTIVV